MARNYIINVKPTDGEREQLVKIITGNRANRFTVDELNRKSLDELRGFAALARHPGPPVTPPNAKRAKYTGQGGQAPVNNAQAAQSGHSGETLPLPSLDEPETPAQPTANERQPDTGQTADTLPLPSLDM